MSKISKIGVVFLNLVLGAILVAAIADKELRVPGIVFVIVVCIIWERTRE